MRNLFIRASSQASGVIAGVIITLAGSQALAGPFGGFARDERRYLVDRDNICMPVAIPADFAEKNPGQALQTVPTCNTADTATLSSWRFRRGQAQRGSEAVFAATARGRMLSLQSRDPRGNAVELVTWEASDPIARVVAVYASPNRRLVAVEYEVRFAGRLRVEVIGFTVPGAEQSSGSAESEPPSSPSSTGSAPVSGSSAEKSGSAPAATGQAAPKLPAAAAKALKKAQRAARGKRHRAAFKAYRTVLSADPEHSEARFGIARAYAGQKQQEDAVRALQTLAASRRVDKVIWLVEARFDKAFSRLRADTGFRAAVGLDRAPGTKAHIYERLVGFTSTWEQPETTCENAEVALKLDRHKRTFRLRITSRCGGYKDVTRLRGRWDMAVGDQVILTLPNKKAKEEAVVCRMQTCSDEDCLRCVLDRDLEFVLRPVRR